MSWILLHRFYPMLSVPSASSLPLFYLWQLYGIYGQDLIVGLVLHTMHLVL